MPFLGRAAAAKRPRRGGLAVRSGGFSRRFLRCKRDRTAVAPNVAAVARVSAVRACPLWEGEVSEASWNARGGYRSKCPASSVRWRSLRPPNVVLGETRQLCRILVAFTAPCLGRASSMSKTFAVSRNGGGSSSSAPIDTLPALRSRLSCARSARTSFVLRSASMRPCVHALIHIRAETTRAVRGLFGGPRRSGSRATRRGPGAPRTPLFRGRGRVLEQRRVARRRGSRQRRVARAQPRQRGHTRHARGGRWITEEIGREHRR